MSSKSLSRNKNNDQWERNCMCLNLFELAMLSISLIRKLMKIKLLQLIVVLYFLSKEGTRSLRAFKWWWEWEAWISKDFILFTVPKLKTLRLSVEARAISDPAWNLGGEKLVKIKQQSQELEMVWWNQEQTLDWELKIENLAPCNMTK